MSINTNRARLSKAIDNKSYRRIWIQFEYSKYWDEGINFYPRYKRGSKNPNKRIQSYQVRMYKTWKYNRNTQWKEKPSAD